MDTCKFYTLKHEKGIAGQVRNDNSFRMKRITGFFACLLICSTLSADEGMWMLNRLNESNWARMRELGFTMSPEQLYDTIQPSLKDAVVIFGGGCTGVTVSDKGLIMTNHHCGYDAIQSKSTVEHDYLRDGFVAHTLEEEIPVEGLSVRYLVKTIDVTPEVLGGLNEEMTENERAEKINLKAKEIEKRHTNDSLSIEARVSPYFANNAFYVNVYEVLSDVRLAFAPPSSVGKFGGDTDNWMWPRHTGDFSVFRAYRSPEHKQGYHKENIPYKPKQFVHLHLDGYHEHSYAMTIGFPGRTNRYLSSWGVFQRVESQNKPRIEVRGIKQEIWKKAMLQSDAVRIKYASKYARSSNYWKNSIGMNLGIEKMSVIERKQTIEQDFRNWLDKNPEKKATYGTALDLLEQAYTSTNDLQRISTFLMEAFSGGTEIVRYAGSVANLDPQKSNHMEEFYQNRILPSYKDYEPALDEKVLAAMLHIVKERVPAQYQPGIFLEIDKKYKGNYGNYAAGLFKKSKIPYPDKLKEILLNPKKVKDLEKDPAVLLAKSVQKALTALQDQITSHRYNIIRGERLFFAGLQEMNPNTNFPSDANSTMRMSYGRIHGYVPYDGAKYEYYTTAKGIFEKYKKDDPEFHVQPELLALLERPEPGENYRYRWNVNFLSDNDITGGNSGSPVFNEKGELIGLAFDGNWEAMSGDIAFETDIQRCIGVDIRYILFIMSDWGKAQNLLDEISM